MLLWIICVFMSCVSHAFASVHFCIVVTSVKGLSSWLLLVMFIVCFVTFPCGILGQVRYLIVSFPALCRLSYFQTIQCGKCTAVG